MSENPSSVPLVRRPRGTGPKPLDAVPVRYTVPSRYDAQFPPPDDEHDDVDQVAFAGQYLGFVILLIVATAGFAAFVLVPMVGVFLSA
ncbi:MAG: hypothetical protein ABL901_05015 [Hyphomicrobiaceae bacterium]